MAPAFLKRPSTDLPHPSSRPTHVRSPSLNVSHGGMWTSSSHTWCSWCDWTSENHVVVSKQLKCVKERAKSERKTTFSAFVSPLYAKLKTRHMQINSRIINASFSSKLPINLSIILWMTNFLYFRRWLTFLFWASVEVFSIALFFGNVDELVKCERLLAPITLHLNLDLFWHFHSIYSTAIKMWFACVWHAEEIGSRRDYLVRFEKFALWEN